MIHPDTFLQKTHKGYGLFAGRDFKRGEIIWLIDDYDIKIPLHEYKLLDKTQQQKLNTYSYMDINSRVIIPWDEGKYVNHSCEPNSTALAQFDNMSMAIRDINAGEEIVEDYGCYVSHFETFRCQCGSPHCRGEISSNQHFRHNLRIDIADIADAIKATDQYLLKIKNGENKNLLEILDMV
jgi:SET domain-containing protein